MCGSMPCHFLIVCPGLLVKRLELWGGSGYRTWRWTPTPGILIGWAVYGWWMDVKQVTLVLTARPLVLTEIFMPDASQRRHTRATCCWFTLPFTAVIKCFYVPAERGVWPRTWPERTHRHPPGGRFISTFHRGTFLPLVSLVGSINVSLCSKWSHE